MFKGWVGSSVVEYLPILQEALFDPSTTHNREAEVKIVNFIVCIFYCNLKKHPQITTTEEWAPPQKFSPLGQ